jgi:hypothetical protein
MIATGVHLLLCVRADLDTFLHVAPNPVDSKLVKNVQNQICITTLTYAFCACNYSATKKSCHGVNQFVINDLLSRKVVRDSMQ